MGNRFASEDELRSAPQRLDLSADVISWEEILQSVERSSNRVKAALHEASGACHSVTSLVLLGKPGALSLHQYFSQPVSISGVCPVVLAPFDKLGSL